MGSGTPAFYVVIILKNILYVTLIQDGKIILAFLISILILLTYCLEKDMKLVLLDNYLQVSFQGDGLELGVYSPARRVLFYPLLSSYLHILF